MRRFREHLTLAFIALLPFHALLVTVGTKLILGPGHAPMPMLAGWKEGLLALILVFAALEFVTSGKRKAVSGKFDFVDALIGALFVIALLLPKTNFLFGFKYDFIPLIAFVMLRRVPWSDQFKSNAMNLILIVGTIVAAYGILSFWLPEKFFYMLGYSDAHSLYLPNSPLAAVQQISGTSIRRIQSVMSGPNQLGIWLLIPLSIYSDKLLSTSRKWKIFSIFNFQFSILLIALVLTFSRSAWIAAFVIACVALFKNFSKKCTPYVFAGGGAVLLTALVLIWVWPAVFVRSISLQGHLERPMQAIRVMIDQPFGLGLGSAGPAANRIHPPCVFLHDGDDASWAKTNPDLCVFVGNVQVQPVTPCDCPLIPENWYLQVGVELGWVGFTLYCALIVIILRRLAVESGSLDALGRKVGSKLSVFHFQFSTLLLFFGITLAALFLHAWEDSAVAYTAWVLVAGIIRPWSTLAAPVLSER